MKVLAVEPHIAELPEILANISESASSQGGSIEFTHLDVALLKADLIVALVAHTQFRGIDRCYLNEKICRGPWRKNKLPLC